MKIIGSDFFKIVPEMITSNVAAENYALEVPALVESIVTPPEQMEHPGIEKSEKKQMSRLMVGCHLKPPRARWEN
ncbi:hypothetical protein Hdeb2414_s0017g00511431 [Helianthus debilis subsp. tardiflorus]